MSNVKPSEARVWLKHFPQASRTAEIPYRTLYESIRHSCEIYADRKAIYYYGTSVTYANFIKIVDRLAESYQALGVKEGDMVSFLVPTMPESIYSLYAINKLGAIPNFIDPRMDIDRILDAAEGVHSRLLVTIDLAWPKVAKLLDKLTVEKIIAVSANTSLMAPIRMLRSLMVKAPKIPYDDKILSWKTFTAMGKGQTVTAVDYKENSVAAVTYTGGTTGTPKGVMLTNDGLNTMADSFLLSGVHYNPTDRFLEIMPIFASYGIGCGVHMPLTVGIELVVIPQFTPDKLGGMVKKYRINHMMGVPSFYEQIMHSAELKDADLSFWYTSGCGGDTMNPGLQSRFNSFLAKHGAPYKLSQGYGMSEMSGAATACFSDVYRDNSSGIPLLASVVGIFDPDTGEELGYNIEGEICMRGRNMMLGYHNMPEETAEVMRTHADGTTWIHSGDIGTIDEDGFVYIKGRIKQIIIRFDGHKVFPVSIEGVLNKHKAIGECAVIDIKDPTHAQGEVPLGIVTLKNTLNADEVDLEALRRELMALAYEKCEERGRPADIVFIDEMLHTALHKHDYRALYEKYKDHEIRPL